MNQTSNLYASAVLHARERTFLTEEVFRRLEGASLAEAGRILAECGWEDERAKLFALLREVGTCPTFLDCHASAEDYFNCRCALKFKQSGNATFRRLASPLGLIPAEKIFACVLADAPEELPPDMRRGIRRSTAG